MTVRTFMPPKPAQALEQHVSRREVGDDEIEVNVHALFHDLRGDENTTGTIGGTILSKAFEPVMLQFGTSLKRKTAVQEPNASGAFTNRAGDRAEGVLSFDNGIANPENVLACFGASDEPVTVRLGDNGWPEIDLPMSDHSGLTCRQSPPLVPVVTSGYRRSVWFATPAAVNSSVPPGRSEVALSDHGATEVYQFTDQRL